VLLRFEGPAGWPLCQLVCSSAAFENYTASNSHDPVANALGLWERVSPRRRFYARRRWDHRQDSKGTRWMPWHLEPMKDVDDCDKPR
jgi:hypothetical protein